MAGAPTRRARAGVARAGSLAPASSGAAVATFAGSCEIKGPIEPAKPINIIPSLGARFSVHGRGTCSGTIDGKPRNALRARLDVNDAETLFDTCELGPDVGVPLTLSIRRARKSWARFPLTLEMLRVATIGPFIVHGPGGGRASGLARLVPPDLNTALVECGDLAGGLTDATLEASFTTSADLVGS